MNDRHEGNPSCLSFSYAKITSRFTISTTSSLIPFILRTHSIGSSALSCSVTPSEAA